MPPSTSWPGGTKREKKGGGPPPTPSRPEPVREDFIDFPTAWRIQREGVTHTSVLCSAVHADGALLCDCGAVEDEWKRRVLAQQGVPDDAPRPDAPRPEPVATADLILDWRADAASMPREIVMEWGDRLAKALEDTAAERDRAVSDLALERAAANRLDEIATQALAERDRLVSGMAEALEQRDAMRHQRDRAHATLREIVTTTIGAKNSAVVLVNKARERLENP